MRSCLVACLCKALLRKEGATLLQKWKNLKSEQLSSASERKEWLPRKFMKTSWTPSGGSLLLMVALYY